MDRNHRGNKKNLLSSCGKFKPTLWIYRNQKKMYILKENEYKEKLDSLEMYNKLEYIKNRKNTRYSKYNT